MSTRTLLSRLRDDEGGWALVTAMILMAVMLATGVAMASFTDTQTKMSGQMRTRETAFNLAEAALNGQVFALAAEWPGPGYTSPTASTQRSVPSAASPAGHPYAPCTETNTSALDVRCPNVAQLRGLFPTPDADPDATWETRVIDNGGPAGSPTQFKTYYSDAALASAVGYDANGDDRVWVRASATVKGRTRTLMSMVRLEHQYEDVVHSAVLAGAMQFGNQGANGNKEFVVTDGSTPSFMVGVRCQYTPPLLASQQCLGYAPADFPDTTKWTDALHTAISPFVVQQNYVGGAMTPETRDRLIRSAFSQGTQFSSCDAAKIHAAEPADKPFKIVVLDFHGQCSLTGSDTWYSNESPGLLILKNSDSTIEFGGTTTFNGVIYHANMGTPASSGVLVATSGNAQINGGVLIDGPGQLFVGQSGGNIKFVDRAFGSVQSIGTAGIVQNTWRELKVGS
jgi:hypothetical protein